MGVGVAHEDKSLRVMAKGKTRKNQGGVQRSTGHRSGGYTPSRAAQPEESGAIYKDWGGRLAVALTMPNTYYVGMSSLALQLLYAMFNRSDDVVCERIFWEKGAAQAGKPLLSLENERPAAEFDVWAFTISWEMDYFNVIELLRQANVPLLAKERANSVQWDGR